MKLLLIHNDYGVYSGEEAVVDRQTALFREMGHAVSVYRKTTAGKRGTLSGNIAGLLQGFYAPSAVRDIKQMLKTDKPDAVIIHNLYPYISPAVLKPIKEAGVPVIMTVHNYRLICPTGLFMRNAYPCEYCLDKGNEWGCIKYNCEHSRLKSLGYAGRNWYARITHAYRNNVDIYACLTGFQQEKLILAGYPPERMTVIPNFINIPNENPVPVPGEYVAVSGRLSREKGIDLILATARQTPAVRYHFAGSIREEDKGLIANAPENCLFLGQLSSEQLPDFYRNARFVLIGSRCYEGFPMVIPEASSYRKPTIAPAHGGFPEIVEDRETGLLFIPDNAEDIRSKVEELWNNPDKAMSLGNAAYEKVNTHYSSKAVSKLWEALFCETGSR